MNIQNFGHYYKHKTGTYNMVERITVIEILEDGFAVCAKGHITASDKAHCKFKMPVKKIKTTLTEQEKKALAEDDKYRKEERKRKQTAKRSKNQAIEKEIREYMQLREKLFAKNIDIPLMSFLMNKELEKLLQSPEEYIPELKNGERVTVFAYDRKKRCYSWYVS